MRIRKIDGENFVVTVRFVNDKVLISGNNKKTNDKIIEIPKEEAIAFVECECDGKLEKLFDHLCYDKEEDVLYLVGKEGVAGLGTIEEKPGAKEESRASNF